MKKYLLPFVSLILLLSLGIGYSQQEEKPGWDTVYSIIKSAAGTFLKIQEDGSIDVNVQDQHTRALDLKFIRVLQPPSQILTAPIELDDNIFLVSSTAGMSAGQVIGFVNPDGSFYFGSIISFIVDTSVTVDTPSDSEFPILNTSTIIATDEMTSLGGTLANPVIYQIAGVGAATGVELDITRILGTIEDDDLMDNSLFGGEPALTNGIVLRLRNGHRTNYWNIKTNGDFKRLCFDATYDETGPAQSQYSLTFRNSYAGRDKHGVTIRLEPGWTLEIWVQDPMLNESFKAGAQGHLVTLM